MRRLLLVAAALSLLTAGCAGVPSSSRPQIIGPVGGVQSSAPPTIRPVPGADQRAIVRGFLTANASDDARHTAARAFLTPEAKNRWSDSTVTVVSSELIGNYDPTTATVTVSGRPLGTINASGIYIPVLHGDGTGGDPLPFVFGMKRVSGEWRIDNLKNGVIVTAEQFSAYQQRRLFFFDLSEERLVPDPRYSALTDPNQLANWLMTQLFGGPRPELQNAVNTELPAQTDPHSVTVTTGALLTIEIPGVSQLDSNTRNHLAAQLAYTLSQLPRGSPPITLTDGGRPVTIPVVASTRFTASDFSWAVEPANLAPIVYYVRPNGGIVDEDAKPLPGALGNGGYALRTVALTNPAPDEMWLAGTTGPPDDARLLVGTLARGLHGTAIHGSLSRPTWAPHLDEVWVGNGALVERASTTGALSPVPVTSPGRLPGRVTALRFSPEGSRIAMVLAASDRSSQVWIGSVVRNGDQVRIDSLEPISPVGVSATDVAWNGDLKLFTIGKVQSSGEVGICEVQVDGSLWTLRRSDTTLLPLDPDSITVAQDAPAWVSADGAVFTQRANVWQNPGNVATPGTNPVYLGS